MNEWKSISLQEWMIRYSGTKTRIQFYRTFRLVDPSRFFLKIYNFSVRFEDRHDYEI